MDKGLLRNLLILLLASALFFALFRYISYLKVNIKDLENQKQNLLQDLEKEKNTVEKLNLKNKSLTSNLQAVHKRLGKSFSDLKLSEKRFEELNSRTSLLKAENSALLEDRNKLIKGSEAFKATLTATSDSKTITRESDGLTRLEGNQGLLIKSGQSTVAPKVKIEVVPTSER